MPCTGLNRNCIDIGKKEKEINRQALAPATNKSGDADIFK